MQEEPAGSVGRLAEQYRVDGYCVAERALRADEVAALIAEATRLCRDEPAKLDGAGAVLGDAGDMAQALAADAETLGHSRIVDVLTRAIGPNVGADLTSAANNPDGIAAVGSLK